MHFLCRIRSRPARKICRLYRGGRLMNRAVVQQKSPSGAPNFPMARPVVPKAAAVAHPAQRLATSPRTPSAAPFPHRPQPTAPLPYRPQAAPAVQRLRTQQQKPASAIQRHPAPHSVATRGSVIQCWRCNECGHEIAYSYDHSERCRLYYHRTYETVSDRDSNRYDRRPGEGRTRSGSFERQYSSGWDERRHYHENRYSGPGYVESQRGYWDSRGVYHSY